MDVSCRAGGEPSEQPLSATKISVRKAIFKWILFGSTLCGMLLFSLGTYKFIEKHNAFLNTSSPRGTYRVYLTGQKQRPLFFTVEVRFNVLKNGTSFLSNKYLHSGDSGDLSFEMGYPSLRWINEGTIQFYREEYFNDGKPDTLIVVNNSRQRIKYAKVESVDKFLLFDMEPGSSTRMLNSRPRGDSKWLSVEGGFSDGSSIAKNSVALPRRKELGVPMTYCVYLNDDKSTFDTCK
jgi:hypothetical protein